MHSKLFITYYKLNISGRFDEIPISTFEDMYIAEEERAKRNTVQSVVQKNTITSTDNTQKANEMSTITVEEQKKESPRSTSEISDNLYLQVSNFDSFVEENLEYPSLAKTQNIEGVVSTQVTINTKGEVIKALIYQSDNHIFDKEALRLTKEFQWEPIYLNGQLKTRTTILYIGFFIY